MGFVSTRRNSAAAFEANLPKPDVTVFQLSSDPVRCVPEFIAFLNANVSTVHPRSDIGWWCCYAPLMKHVLPYLADALEEGVDGFHRWNAFRMNVADQVACCRQCAMAYHKAAAEWEQELSKSDVKSTVCRARIKALLEWDVQRLIPMIRKGLVDVSHEEYQVAPEKTLCREALYEAIGSIRVCMHNKFCEELGKLFDRRVPINARTEVVPFINSVGAVPTGLLALVFHNTPGVRFWAQQLYKSAAFKLPICQASQTFLIVKVVHSLEEMADGIVALDMGKDAATQWAPSELAMREGLAVLLLHIQPGMLKVLYDCMDHVPFIKALVPGLKSSNPDMFSASYETIVYLMRSVGSEKLFGDVEMTHAKFINELTALLCDESCRMVERRRILAILKLLFAEERVAANPIAFGALINKCVEALNVAVTVWKDRWAVRGNRTSTCDVAYENRGLLTDFFKAGVEIMTRAYRHAAPRIPFVSPSRIVPFVVQALKFDDNGTWSWKLLRIMLFTDIFNMLRSMYERKDVAHVGRALLNFKPGTESRTNDLKDVADILGTSLQGVAILTWMGPLWIAIESGAYQGQRIECNIDTALVYTQLMLDIHLVVGSLNPKFCGESIAAKLDTIEWIPVLTGNGQKTFAKRIEGVQRTALSCLRRNLDLDDVARRLKELPFHASHLLTGSNEGVSRKTVILLQRQNGLEKLATPENVSIMNIILRVMGSTAGTARLLEDGCLSFMELMVALRSNVSSRTYASFLHWYRSLVMASPNILKGNANVQNMLGVVLQFIESWRKLEAEAEKEAFAETCRMFFGRLADVWPKLSSSGDEALPWLKKTVRGLLGMSALTDIRNVERWISLVTHKNVLPFIRKNKELFDEWKRNVELVSQKNLNAERKHQLLSSVSSTVNSGSSSRAIATRIDSYFSAAPTGTERPNTSLGGTRIRGLLASRDVARKQWVSGYLMRELRREHVSEEREKAGKGRRARQAVHTGKTRFELERERHIAERKRKEATRNEERESKRKKLGASPLAVATARVSPGGEKGTDEEEGMQRRIEGPFEKYTLPHTKKVMKKVNIDVYLRDILSYRDVALPAKVSDPREQSFSSIQTYADYWAPLLAQECRADIVRCMEEEDAKSNPLTFRRELGQSRAIFKFADHGSNNAYVREIELSAEEGFNAEYSGDNSVDPAEIQVLDVVVIYIPPHGMLNLGEVRPIEFVKWLGVVSNSAKESWRTKQLKVKVGRGCLSSVRGLGIGRKLVVSKIGKMTGFQRQFDALNALAKAPEGLLWTLLEPAHGLLLQQEIATMNQRSTDSDCAKPRSVVGSIGRECLNTSQSDAILHCLKSCGPTFKRVYGNRFHKYVLPDRGSISLIQGPPGTGKTSTIVSMLSTLLGDHRFTLSMSRRTSLTIEGESFAVKARAVRVLVCAPSNSAVDEIQARVMKDGLKTCDGSSFVPMIVRVGKGTTMDELRPLELLSRLDANPRNKEKRDEQRRHRQEFDDLQRRLNQLDCESNELNSTSRATCLDPDGLIRRVHAVNDERAALLRRKRDMRDGWKAEIAEEHAARRRESVMGKVKCLNSASIVFATLSSSGSDVMKNLSTEFDIIIIDEAGQSCEPDILIPLTTGGYAASKPMHVVMVGDPQQLPATVISNDNMVSKCLGVSLFERLSAALPSSVRMLNVQYRMHPEIAAFPSNKFYGGLLDDGPNVIKNDMTRPFHLDEKKRFGPLSFIDLSRTNARESRSDGKSLSNEHEAEWILECLLALFVSSNKKIVGQMAVVSPYKKQVKNIRRMIRRNLILSKAGIEVSTVDGIQGREKSIVLMSTVRSGHSTTIGFVQDPRRLNVAITRAKHSLIIFGNAEFLSQHSEPWKELVAHCESTKAVVQPQRIYPHPFFSDVPRKWLTPSPETIRKRKADYGASSSSFKKRKVVPFQPTRLSMVRASAYKSIARACPKPALQPPPLRSAPGPPTPLSAPEPPPLRSVPHTPPLNSVPQPPSLQSVPKLPPLRSIPQPPPVKSTRSPAAPPRSTVLPPLCSPAATLFVKPQPAQQQAPPRSQVMLDETQLYGSRESEPMLRPRNHYDMSDTVSCYDQARRPRSRHQPICRPGKFYNDNSEASQHERSRRYGSRQDELYNRRGHLYDGSSGAPRHDYARRHGSRHDEQMHRGVQHHDGSEALRHGQARRHSSRHNESMQRSQHVSYGEELRYDQSRRHGSRRNEPKDQQEYHCDAGETLLYDRASRRCSGDSGHQARSSKNVANLTSKRSGGQRLVSQHKQRANTQWSHRARAGRSSWGMKQTRGSGNSNGNGNGVSMLAGLIGDMRRTGDTANRANMR